MWRQVLVAVLLSGAFGSTLAAREVSLNGHLFTLPDGFEIELVAGPPLVDRPITAAFDEEGRLYVADSSGSNDKVDKQLAERPHRIVRLEDTDGDGRFDKSVVYADKLMFPEGTMWLDGSLYVAAPPSIWKLTDTDGDGVADRREEWFAGKTLTGCANDLHGPYLGPDGWIYWCKGAFARQTYERVGKSLRVIPGLPNNILGKDVPAVESSPHAPREGSASRSETPTWSTRASHIFRCRPDGSGLEVVMTGGMDNPVDVVFTSVGERIFTTTFLQHPGGGRRDGLIHAIYGGIYGKDHDPLHESQHKWTGELMPPLSHLGAAAPCGLTRYESRVFGPEYQDNLFACCFNMHKITRHVLEPDGAGLKSRDEDFLVSNHLDFHPTDVLDDADGSLLVVDTGGWYKLCCPTSQLQKPEVLGAIYRVRRTGAPKIDDPRGLKIDWSRVTVYLPQDDRPAVRQRAIREISQRYNREETNANVGLQRQLAGQSEQVRLDAVWTLTRMKGDQPRELLASLLRDHQESVRHAALHSVSLGRWNDDSIQRQLLELLDQGTPRDRRLAAEALGRIGDQSVVPQLLAAAARVELNPVPAGVKPDAGTTSAPSVDRALEHSFIYALIELADPAATAKGLASDNPHVRRVALIALDQMEGGGLQPQQIVSLLASPDAPVRDAASWIVGRHTAWGPQLASYLQDRLATPSLTELERDELTRQLTQFARTPAVQENMATSLIQAVVREENELAVGQVVLRAMRDAGVKETPSSWHKALSGICLYPERPLVPLAISTLRALPPPKQDAELYGGAIQIVARAKTVSAELRVHALAAMPPGLPIDPDQFDFLREQLNSELPVAQRSAAAEALTKGKLTPYQLEAIIVTLQSAGPLEVDRLLAAFEQTTDEALGLMLVEVLTRVASRLSLRADTIKLRLQKYGPAVHSEAEKLYATINADAAKQRERLEEMLKTFPAGDVRRGQVVFMSAKAACASCHAIGYLGGKVGPDLTRIGGIRNERDLLESIAFPSASFVRSYESVTVVTHEGKVVNGILRKDSDDEVVLAINATEEARIARDQIEEMRLGTVSVMPSGLDQQLTREQLADLVAFLRAAK